MVPMIRFTTQSVIASGTSINKPVIKYLRIASIARVLVARLIGLTGTANRDDQPGDFVDPPEELLPSAEEPAEGVETG